MGCHPGSSGQMGGRERSAVATGGADGGLQSPPRDDMAREGAARDTHGRGWCELAGTFGWQVSESVAEGAVRMGVESLSAGPGREGPGPPMARILEDAG